MTDQEPSHTIAQFLAATGERDHPGDVFELESASMLEVHVNGRIWSKLGAMVAYRGNLKFIREGAFEGGLGQFVTKMVSGEAAPLTKIEGSGIAYLADPKQEHHHPAPAGPSDSHQRQRQRPPGLRGHRPATRSRCTAASRACWPVGSSR